MRNKRAKHLRNLASNKSAEDTAYEKQTFHHVYTGRDKQGDKTFAEVTDPIRLSICTRLEYKRLKHDYKTNH